MPQIPHELHVEPNDQGVGCVACSCGWKMGYPFYEIDEETVLAMAKPAHDRPKDEGGAL